MAKVTRENIEDSIFSYMLETMGKTSLELVDAYNWRFEFTMTREQYIEFKKHCVELIMKTLRVSKNKALVAFERFWQQYGVRIKN